MSGICPRRIRCAVVMILLSAACLNTSVRRTTGTTPLSIKSPSTVPGPTDGSWSTSPTRINPAWLLRARTSECISSTSTIEVSSTTNRSHASGFDSSLVNRPVAGLISSRRWMVFASMPVVSVSRFAARPVGAHSRHFTPLTRKIIRIEFTSVVFPTPGPPVITTIRFPRTVFSAARWLGARVLPVRPSHHATAFSKSIGG